MNTSFFGILFLNISAFLFHNRLVSHSSRFTTISTIGCSTNLRDLVSSYGVSSTTLCAWCILKPNGKQWTMGIQYSVIKAVLSRILSQKTKRSDSACNSITTLRHVTTTKERERERIMKILLPIIQNICFLSFLFAF